MMDILSKLEAIHEQYQYLQEQLSNPEIVSDMKKFTRTNKDYKKIEPIVNAYKAYKAILTGIAEGEEILKEEKDGDFREMAKMELEELRPQKEALEEDIKVLLIPKDPEDEKDVIMEIRSGTGGDEASIFAGDLYRMYVRLFDTFGWKHEIISVNEGSSGGYNKIVLEVTGDEVYSKLKFESGAHRVQRVPKTESQGRVHTSAATVAVMPQFEMEDVNINKSDLKVDTFRASGAGGQHVNKTESAIRITHLPSGVVAESQDSRHQFRNREIALQRLYVKINDIERAKFNSEVSNKRKSLVGSGDRSDKIRTYNYPQNRVTDHRIGFTSHNLSGIMDGDVLPVIEALQMYENAEKMKGEEEEV
ncbi:MAG: peptide chain release factor 1 [Saprospiraceae bacterium]|nr:peptide chain release factor 1 [Saprospiraceae bacterium]